MICRALVSRFFLQLRAAANVEDTETLNLPRSYQGGSHNKVISSIGGKQTQGASVLSETIPISPRDFIPLDDRQTSPPKNVNSSPEIYNTLRPNENAGNY